jgi:hypothetical protein
MQTRAQVPVGQISGVTTVKRVIRFQAFPNSLSAQEHHLIREGKQEVSYKLRTASDPTEHTLRYTGDIVLDSLMPGSTATLTLFGTEYQITVRADVQSDPKRVSWYRERLYMLGFVGPEELERPDIVIPAASAPGAAAPTAPAPAPPAPAAPAAGAPAAPPAPATPATPAEFRDLLSQEFLDALFEFQASHRIPLDDNLVGDSDSIQRTRVALDLDAGT